MTLPSAKTIDYTDYKEVCGYQMLICKMLELAGGLSNQGRSNAEARAIRSEGDVWLRNVRKVISDILIGNTSRLEAIPDLLSSYDFLIRICTGSPSYGYLRDIRLKTVDKWLKGDRSISETDIVLMLLSEVYRDNLTLDSRYSNFSLSVMDDWIRELTIYGTFRNTQATDAYNRLNRLLQADLSAYFCGSEQTTIKSGWISAYSLSDQEIDGLNTQALQSYIGFTCTSSRIRHATQTELQAQHTHLLSKLSTRPDLHPYYREAIEF